MKYHPSLGNRIAIAFCLFGLVLSLTYWLLIDISMNITEDMVFKNRLQNELDNYFDRRLADTGATLPYSLYIKSYIGTSLMPQPLQEMVQGLSRGFYETDGPGAIKGPGDYHVVIEKIPKTDDLIYLFYDTGTLKFNEQYEILIRVVLFLVSMGVTLIGGCIGIFIARRMIAPLRDLARCVGNSRPENLPLDLSRRFANDEIGLLARALEQSMQRIQSFIEREQAFTRDASHELRTPVTVIKGAAELITGLPAYREKSLQRPVNRIQRSVRDMALTIDTFLWLAREEVRYKDDKAWDVADQVEKAFKDHESIFRAKGIGTRLIKEASPGIEAPAAVFRIVINNLLRNAFSHTSKGEIIVTLRDDEVELFNSAPFKEKSHPLSRACSHARREEDQGFGFGLVIVRRLCERFHWQVLIREGAKGTRVSLYFGLQGPRSEKDD